jgi:filamentous hemagglutinin family protein
MLRMETVFPALEGRFRTVFLMTRSGTWLLAGLLAVGAARANPRGGVVAAGAAAITQAGKILTIRQSSPQAIINWQAFENTASETINFQQLGPTSVTLNRVVGINPSLISGNLTANGQLFLINPNGIIFGPTARVNVNSLVASSLQISDADFMNKNYVLVQDFTKELSSVINRGQITAAPRGTVALVAPIVDNSGSIVAAAGRIILTASTHGAIDTTDPNTGAPTAAGSPVRMAQIGFTPLLSDVVNTAAIPAAKQVEVLADGTVFLHGAGGIAVNGGSLRVDSTATANAGSVVVNADLTVAVGRGSVISATGTGSRAGTGSVMITANPNGLRYAGQSTANPATRAVIQGGTVEVRTLGDVKSDANGALEFRGGKITITSFGDQSRLGDDGKPIRVNAAEVFALAEKNIVLIADGDITLDTVRSFEKLTVTAGGSILSGPALTGGDGNVGLNFGSNPDYLNVFGRQVNLQAGNLIGGPSRALSVFQEGGNPTFPPGSNVARPDVGGIVRPGLPTTIGLNDATARSRPTYIPPVDGPVSTDGNTIGRQDNVLLPSLRNTVVKQDSDSASDQGDGPIVVVRRSDPADDADRPEKRLARVTRRSRSR